MKKVVIAGGGVLGAARLGHAGVHRRPSRGLLRLLSGPFRRHIAVSTLQYGSAARGALAAHSPKLTVFEILTLKQ